MSKSRPLQELKLPPAAEEEQTLTDVNEKDTTAEENEEQSAT